MSDLPLARFVEGTLKEQGEETREVLELMRIIEDMIPTDAFYYTVSLTCNWP